MKKLYLLLFLLLLPLASALNSYEAEYNIVNNRAIVEIDIDLGKNLTYYTLELPLDAIAIESTNKRIKIDKNKVIFSDSEFSKVNIKYITDSIVEKSGKDYNAIVSFLEANNVNITIKLPEKGYLKYTIDSDKQSLFPMTDKIISDGKKIILKWEEDDLTNNAILVIYKKDDNGALQLILLSILILISLSALFIFKKRRKKGLTKNLYEEEKNIVEILSKGELWQKELLKKSGLTKVKLSRKIRSLKQKGIIEKIPYGNSNKIRIKE